MMSKFPSQEMDRFNIRLPAGMRDAIAERAKANGRSMNSEIVQILEDALNPDIPHIDKSLDLKQIKTLLDRISKELWDRTKND